MSIQSVNPATGDLLETFTPTSDRELEGILATGHAAFLEWRAVPFTARAQRMREAARTLRRRQAEFARTMTLEMGKPIVQAEAEVEKCAWTCDYYAERPDPRQDRRLERSRSATGPRSAPADPCRSRLSAARPRRSGLQRELLERVAAGRDMAAAPRERPRHLAHVHVAVRVDPDAVRRSEAAGRDGVRPAPTAMPCGRKNSPGPWPGTPHDRFSSPVGEKRWTRQLP